MEVSHEVWMCENWSCIFRFVRRGDDVWRSLWSGGSLVIWCLWLLGNWNFEWSGFFVGWAGWLVGRLIGWLLSGTARQTSISFVGYFSDSADSGWKLRPSRRVRVCRAEKRETIIVRHKCKINHKTLFACCTYWYHQFKSVYHRDPLLGRVGGGRNERLVRALLWFGVIVYFSGKWCLCVVLR